MDYIFWMGNGTWKPDSWLYMVYYDSWNSVWKAVFQDGKAFVYAIWHECNWIKGVWKKIGLPVFFYAYHEAAIPLMQIET